MKKSSRPSQRESSPKKSSNIIWLDKHALLELLHISATTLLNWRYKYGLPFYPMDKKIYFDKNELDQLLKRRRTVIQKPEKKPKKK
jgi:hypothetical protein